MSRAAETGKMTARLGRASYVGGESLPPDPGAVGIAALVEGIATALQNWGVELCGEKVLRVWY